MRQLISILLILALAFLLFSCTTEVEARDITCYEVASKYEASGYYVEHMHREGESNYCNLNIKRNSAELDYIYFSFYSKEEDAKAATAENEYNIAVWMFALVLGESRWLNSRCYGKIHYTYYDDALVKPFETLIKGKQ